MGAEAPLIRECSVVDVNERSNIAGAGINMAQRVMDCGDAGHILLSKHVADDLEQYRQWRPHLHELGECEVKHGVRVSVVNLYNEELGNPGVPEKLRNAHQTTPAQTSSIKRAKPSLIGIVAILSLTALAILAAIFAPTILRSREKAQRKNPAPAAEIPKTSIAVLPFENLSEDKANVYFADGIQDEILTRLAKIAELKVISRTSTQRFRSKPEDLKEIATQLGVAHIFEGSAQRSADQVRVNVQLIDAASDTHLWTETYDRKLTDIFGVETEIATKIADTLQAKLTGAEHMAIVAQPTENMEAHELYLKGRYFAARRTHEDTLKAIDYYDQALAKDPNYAVAYAGFAESYAILPQFSRVVVSDVYQKARTAAESALAIASNLAEAHTSLAVVMQATDFNFKEAKREFGRAIALNPNYAPAHYFFASLVLLPLGETDAAIMEMKRAVELDPLSLVMRSRLGSCYIFARHFPEAINSLRKTIDLNPAFAQAQDQLGIALELSGDLDRTVAQFLRLFKASGGDFHSIVFLSHLYGVKGERDIAMQTLEKAKQLQQQNGAEWAYGYALVFTGLGDKEQALTWLERSYQAKESLLLVDIKVDPLLASLRAEPRFEALANKIVLPSLSNHDGSRNQKPWTDLGVPGGSAVN